MAVLIEDGGALLSEKATRGNPRQLRIKRSIDCRSLMT